MTCLGLVKKYSSMNSKISKEGLVPNQSSIVMIKQGYFKKVSEVCFNMRFACYDDNE